MDQLSRESLAQAIAQDSAAGRHGGRDSLLLAARLRLPNMREPVQVRVRNLSSGGLMAEYSGLVTLGQSAEIEVRGIGWVAGRVAWATEGRVGIAFEQLVDPMLARKPVGARAAKGGSRS